MRPLRFRSRAARFALAASLWAASAATDSGAIHAAEPVELSVYAAASLRDVLQELAPAGERATGTRWVLNLGGSNELARQIEAAHRADLFFSADESWMDRLAEAGLVDRASRRSPLSNRLVVVVPAEGAAALERPEDLAGAAVRRLALANPEATPAGVYARTWLERRGLWQGLAERVIPAADVRAALALVETGAVDAGIVYRTDARRSTRVRVAYEVPASEGPEISYALAALADRPHLDAARAVALWLSGPEAAAVFEKAGFVARPSG